MEIRPATSSDCAAIAAIWNPVIRDTACTFTTQQKTPSGLGALIDEKRANAMPFLVAELDGGIAGFATYGQFRAGPGYARTMEHSIILAPDARGRGIGRALMGALEACARDQGVHSLWAGVSAENEAGVAFHKAIGYREMARLPEVGRKFGRWMDLILLQKIL